MKSSWALVVGVVTMWQLACSGDRRQSTPAVSVPAPPPYQMIEFASPLQDAAAVSLVRILADADAMHGKAVHVGGFMHLQFEEDVLCLHRDDVSYMLLTNCVWLAVPDRQKALALNDRYVEVQAVVNANEHGHLGAFQSELQGVTSIGALSEEQAARRLKSQLR